MPLESVHSQSFLPGLRELFTYFQKVRTTRRRRQQQFLPERLETRLLLAGDLSAHWLADDLAGEVTDGAAIAAWTDSVANLESTGSGAPILVTNQLGGRAFVRFQSGDGADSFFLDGDQNPLSGADDFSVVVVFRTASQDLAGGNEQWFQNTGIVDANLMGFGHDWGLSVNATGQLATGLGAGLGIDPTTVYSTASGLNDGQLHVAVVTRTGNALSLAIDDQALDFRDDAPSTPPR